MRRSIRPNTGPAREPTRASGAPQAGGRGRSTAIRSTPWWSGRAPPRPTGSSSSTACWRKVHGARGPHRLQYRFERTERPEEERIAKFRSLRPHLENSILGTTRWTTHTAGYELVALRRSGVEVRPLAEVTYARVAKVGGGLIDVDELYGGRDIWSLALGVRLSAGGAMHRMGRYGAAEDDAGMTGMTMHDHQEARAMTASRRWTWRPVLRSWPRSPPAVGEGTAETAAMDPPPGSSFQVQAGGDNVNDRYSSDLWVHGAWAYTGTWGGAASERRQRRRRQDLVTRRGRRPDAGRLAEGARHRHGERRPGLRRRCAAGLQRGAR